MFNYQCKKEWTNKVLFISFCIYRTLLWFGSVRVDFKTFPLGIPRGFVHNFPRIPKNECFRGDLALDFKFISAGHFAVRCRHSNDYVPQSKSLIEAAFVHGKQMFWDKNLSPLVVNSAILAEMAEVMYGLVSEARRNRFSAIPKLTEEGKDWDNWVNLSVAFSR